MRKRLIIIGAGGHGKVCADMAVKMGQWEEIAFLDDNEGVRECLGFPIIGRITDRNVYKEDAEFIVAIGNNRIRAELSVCLEKEGICIGTLVHPQAVLAEETEIGAGTVIMAGAAVNSGSRIGKGCIVNTGASVDHDCVVDDYVHLSPGVHLAGGVMIGAESWLGIGSIVSNQISICSGCQTGAGAVVVKDIEKRGVYVGVPAGFLREY